MSGTSEERQVGGLSMRFERQGSGLPMVLVHGLLGYSFSWRRVLAIFSKEREVFAPDMPGSGFSECSRVLDAHLSAAAERLLKFLDAMAIDSCDLLGSSYGGTTSLFLATKHPERVRTLILVSPANPWSRIGHKRLTLLNIPVVGQMFPPLARAFRPLHRISVRRMYGDPTSVSAETLRGYSLPLMRKGVFEHALRIAKNWQADMRELEAALASIPPIPTLIIWGTKDRLVEPASGEILAHRLKQSHLTLMNDAGHLPYEEYPEEFAELVVRFLATRSSPVLDGK